MTAYLREARRCKSSGMRQPQRPELRVWRVVMSGPGASALARSMAESYQKRETARKQHPDRASGD